MVLWNKENVTSYTYLYFVFYFAIVLLYSINLPMCECTEWDVQDVKKWLESIGLTVLVDKFSGIYLLFSVILWTTTCCRTCLFDRFSDWGWQCRKTCRNGYWMFCSNRYWHVAIGFNNLVQIINAQWVHQEICTEFILLSYLSHNEFVGWPVSSYR